MPNIKFLKLLAFSFALIGSIFSQQLAQAQSERYPTEVELQKLRKDVQQRRPSLLETGIYLDRRSNQEKRSLDSFSQAWSKVSPGYSEYLGTWSAIEETLSVYPSIYKDRVCIISIVLDHEPEISTGKLTDKLLKNDPFFESFFIENKALVVTTVYRNEPGAYEYMNPMPLVDLSSEMDRLSRDKAESFLSQAKSNGCTSKLPHQAFKEQGDTHYDQHSWSQAIAAYTEALTLSPRYAAIHYNRGMAHHYNGHTQSAIADLGKAAQLYQEQGKYKDRQDALGMLSKLQS